MNERKLMRTVIGGLVVLLITGSVIACTHLDKGNLGLSDFDRNGNANWKVNKKSELVADSGKGYIVTKKTYKDFRLSLDFYAAEKSNSGVFFRCEDAAEINDSKCYEANIFDTRTDQSGRTGAITNIAAPLEVIDTEGKWNTYEVEAKGDRITVHLNGVKTIDINHSKLESGPIALQYIMGEIRFKNIQIQELN